MTIEIDCEQGSEAWFAARCGVITASNFEMATSVLKRASGDCKAGDPSGESEKYALTLAIERISGQPYGDTFQTFAMKRGSEQEMWARLAYERKFDVEVEESGITLTDDRLFGYSRDGSVGADGLIEIKCPHDPLKILSIFKTGDTSEYDHQMQGGLWITGRKWIDFVMYVPELKSVGNDLYVKRILRNEAFIEKLESDLWMFASRVKKAEMLLRAPITNQNTAPARQKEEATA